MTLEMGKAVAESKAEIAYSAEFFRWFSGEALRIDGYYKTAGNGAEPGAGDAPAGRPLLLHHPLELPHRDGHPQDRPRDRRRLHDGRGSRRSRRPLSMLALAKLLEECGLPRGVLNVITSSSSSAVSEPIIADPRLRKLSLHRLDRGRPQADRPGGRERAQGLDGARRQRPVPDLRRRRPRRRGRGRDDRQDAEHRRGLHLGQPLPRRRLAGRRVRREARRADGRAEGRPRHRGGRRRRPADRRRPALEGGRAGRRRRRQGRQGRRRRRQASTAPATSSSRPCSATCPPTPAC